MESVRHFEFFSKDGRDPYIEKLIEYNITKTEGIIHFKGHYYVLNHEFPRHIFFHTSVREDTPYEEERIENHYIAKYNIIENKWYEVEIYDREKFQNTSSYDEVKEEDGSKMQSCYFPIQEQKIYFKVITEFSTFDEFLKRTSEYFTAE